MQVLANPRLVLMTRNVNENIVDSDQQCFSQACKCMLINGILQLEKIGEECSS